MAHGYCSCQTSMRTGDLIPRADMNTGRPDPQSTVCSGACVRGLGWGQALLGDSIRSLRPGKKLLRKTLAIWGMIETQE